MSRARPTIGLLTYGVAEPLNHLMWAGVSHAATKQDANVICFPGNPIASPLGFEAQANIVYDLVSSEAVDGLIIWSAVLAHHIQPEQMRSFCQRFAGIPLVNVGLPLDGITSVLADNYGGMRSGLHHLIHDHGYRKIAFIHGPQNHPEVQERFRAYLAELDEHGIRYNPVLVLPGDFKKSAGHRAIHALLDERGVRPVAGLRAVCAANDMMALGAMEALQARGIRVPDDVAVIGLDDAEEGRYVTPPLTTVPYLPHEQGKRAAEILLSILNGERPPVHELLPMRVLLRQSCGCADPAIARARIRPSVAPQSNDEAAPSRLSVPSIAAVLDSPLPDLASRWISQLVEALDSDAAEATEDAFVLSLTQVLRESRAVGVELVRWQDAISALRVTPAGPLDDHALAIRESALHQARVLIAEVAHRTGNQEVLKANQQARAIADIGAALSAAAGVSELANILAESLPRLGIPTCYLAIYEDSRTPAGWSRLVMAYRDGHTVPLEQGGQRFPSQLLVPSEFRVHNRRVDLLLSPLHFREDQLGFALFEAGPEMEEVCNFLRGQISGALKRAQLAAHNIELYTQAIQARTLAEEADQLKSRFLSVVSHELRTPLSLIVGTVDMLLAEEADHELLLPDPYPRDLANIRASSQHLSRLIGDVLDLASSQAGQLRLAAQPLEIREVLDRAIRLGSALAREKGLDWHADIPDNLPSVWGDATRLQQVVLNLISNAVKFTDQGSVSLWAEAGKDHLVVAVSDTGMGIPSTEQEFIFDEFRQSERAASRGYGGMGLGLAISRRLVELHGGQIGVLSSGTVGAGSTFYFTLPLLHEDATGGETPGVRSRRVTVLTGEASRAGRVADYLTRRGFEVETVAMTRHPNWLGQLIVAPPAAVVLDFEPAAEQGWELMQVLRRNPATEDVAVVFYSLLETEDRGGELDLDYLSKPVGSQELARALGRRGFKPDDCRPGQTLLIVDDEPGALALHSRMLERLAPKCRILKANNGRDALDVMARQRPDLVLLDLMMPELDGFGVLEAMQRDELTRSIPVIVLTAQILTRWDMARLQKGVTAVLGKGIFTAQEVLEQVELALARSKQLGTETQRLVRIAMAYIHEHYGDALSRDALANAVGVSERHLSRAFAGEAGMSPMTYLNRYRIRQAKTLLERGEMNITEVALAVGFSDSNYFARVFRQETGVPPSTYLRRERTDPA